MCICVPARVYVHFMHSVACRDQKMVLDHLELVIGDYEPSRLMKTPWFSLPWAQGRDVDI